MPRDTSSLFEYPFSSGELLPAPAVLLVLAAFLLLFSRRRKIALRHSEVSEELMLYLARIRGLWKFSPRVPPSDYSPC